MKIAHIMMYFPSLSTTFTLNQITGLIDLGHEVEIFALWDPENKTIHEDVIKYDLLSKTDYLYKSNNNWKLALIALKSMLFWLKKSPLKTITNCFYLVNSTSFSSSVPRIFLALAPFINKRFDVIHAHFASAPTDWAMIISRFTGTPFIITTHAYDIFEKPNVKELKTKFDNATVVITISKFNKKYLLHTLGSQLEQKIIVLHCGIDLNKFAPVEKGKTNTLTILFVGRLVDKKGLEFAVRAFEKVLKKYTNAEMVMIGDGPLKDDLEKLISKLKLDDKIHLLGALSQTHVWENMNKADIFILPSITAATGDKEGVPVVLMEAQAMKLPVISTLYAGIPEVVIDGKTGFLVPEKDVKALAEKLEILIEDAALRSKMGEGGRNYIEKEYNSNTLNQRLEKILYSVVNKTY